VGAYTLSVLAGASPTPSTRRRTPFIRDALEVALIALVLYVGISFGFQTVRVEGSSMVGTLHDQDFLLALKLTYHAHDPERGDIVVLRPPGGNETRDFIKRVIAIPGDVVEIDGNYVDPQHPGPASTALFLKPRGKGPWMRVVERYLPAPWTDLPYCCGPDGRASDGRPVPLLIPPDRFFVMGDNRNNSTDSRRIGLIPKDNISARAWIRLFPLDHAGGFHTDVELVPAEGGPTS